MGKSEYEILEGDSLKVIPDIRKKYAVVYLDPPFNSKREYKYSANEESHGFNDNWQDQEYEEWLDLMIKNCKKCMKKDGTLYLHISAELSHTPEKVLRRNFKKVEPIFWKKAHGKNTVKNKLGAVVDIIYRAHDNGSKFNLIHVPLNEYYFENSYKNKDSIGFYALGSLKHDKTRRGHFYKIVKDNTTYEAPYGWKINEKKMNELIAEGRIHYSKKGAQGKGTLYKKLYKHETKGKPLSNLWDDIHYITRTTQDERIYPTQKPVELLKRIIQLSSDEGDWVLDPVAGSGTTGIAAIALKRSVTLIDKNKDAIKIIRKRMKNFAESKLNNYF